MLSELARNGEQRQSQDQKCKSYKLTAFIFSKALFLSIITILLPSHPRFFSTWLHFFPVQDL